MNVLLRQEFVRLHTQHALLEDLLAQLTAAHPGLVFQDVPARGELQVERVKASKYFFS
jgi:DNA-directed RNA polymerase